MSDEQRKAIDLGDIPAAEFDAGAIDDQDADKIVGGLGVQWKKPSAPSKGTYIPAPPAAQVPIPYPSGM